jgi:Protein of unknown function (DUF5131)
MAADRGSVYQVPTKRAAIMCRRLSSPDFERRAREQLGTLEQMARDARRITPWRQAMLEDIAAARAGWTWPLPNVWIGVSAGTRETARRLIPWLVRAPAATRFLSCEPLLEELSLEQWLRASRRAAGTGLIHWVIAGGESGSGHRPLDLDHGRFLRDQCQRHGVPFWFKLLCTNSRKRQPAAQQFLITASDRAQNGRWTYSTAGKRIPKSRSMVCRKRELDKVALFRGSVVRSDGDVEQELPASSTADRKQPGDEPRLAINGPARPGLMDGQNLVVHARKPSNRAGKAAA